MLPFFGNITDILKFKSVVNKLKIYTAVVKKHERICFRKSSTTLTFKDTQNLRA